MSVYMKIKSENDKIFNSGNFNMISETFAEVADIPEIKREKYFSVSENTEKSTTVQAVLNYAERGKNITALNFANAMYAGGGYVLGGNAQEESLCRASMLFYTIKTQKEYYRRNRKHIFPDYTDTMIFSKNVPVIRNEHGEMLENPVMCNFITSPAVNRTFAKFLFSKKKINQKMKTRIKKIIMLAMTENTDILILGAYGCGVFGNRREDVLPVFEEAVNKYVPDSVKVIFAIP